MLEAFDKKKNSNSDKGFKFHLSSPPGSGKTIVGLEIARRLGKPALVICPNTTIQGQWVEKLAMFLPDGCESESGRLISTDPTNIKRINVLTYQILSVPCEDDDSFVRLAENLWAETTSGALGTGMEEALLRIGNLRTSNPEAYKKELSKFIKKLRDGLFNEVELPLSRVLHPNTVRLISEIKDKGIETILFDECHHLQNYWALVMKEVVREVGAKYVIGLTATPPADEEGDRLDCYLSLLGEIDYQIPTPAVIKEGMLAPYRDMVYFCTPTEEEYAYIKNCHQKFNQLEAIFNNPDSDMYLWISDRTLSRKLLSGEKQDWTRFVNTRGRFALAGVKFLLNNHCRIPWDITLTEAMREPMNMEDWLCLMEDYSLNSLMLSQEEDKKRLLQDIKEALHNLGYQLTESGIRSQSSMLDRVLAYSRSKQAAVKEILKAEAGHLGDTIRAAVITDFEKSNALLLSKAGSILDDECGGAFSIMKELVADEATDTLDPVMVTGSSLVCDDDLAEKYVTLGREWASAFSFDLSLSAVRPDGSRFAVIEGSGRDWSSRSAVLLTTHLFEKGVTKCIVGTRGLLSEGWDSMNLNTLIDLSTATTYATVNQLRGRSIRKSQEDPDKVADNWDIICVAPGLEKGYNDLNRLCRKHSRFYGMCDDGQIQMGVNHIDPILALSENALTLEDMKEITGKMLVRTGDRDTAYKAWKIGEPFDNKELGCCELKLTKPICMKSGSVLVNERKALKSKVWKSVLFAAGTVTSSAVVVAGAMSNPAVLIFTAVPVLLGTGSVRSMRDMWRFGRENFFGLAVRDSIRDIALCVLEALKECKMIRPDAREGDIVLTERDDGTIRAYLDGSDEESVLFSNSLSEVFAPIEDQRYAIQRFEVFVPQNGVSKFIYLFRYGINRYSPLLSAYHPLPSLFGVKERALIFQKYWNKFVSPGDVVFLKGEKGREVVEKYGRINSLGARKMNLKVWK